MRAQITIGESELASIIARHVANTLRLYCVQPEHVEITFSGATVSFALGAYVEDEKPEDLPAFLRPAGNEEPPPAPMTLAEVIQETAYLDEIVSALLPPEIAPAEADGISGDVADPGFAEVEEVEGAEAEAPVAEPEPALTNAGRPWKDSDIDLALKGASIGSSEETIARNLGRDIAEVYDLLDEHAPSRTKVQITAAMKRWRLTEDLAVLEAKAAGKSSYDISAKMSGRKMADVAARVRALVPKETPEAFIAAIQDIHRRLKAVE